MKQVINVVKSGCEIILDGEKINNNILKHVENGTLVSVHKDRKIIAEEGILYKRGDEILVRYTLTEAPMPPKGGGIPLEYDEWAGAYVKINSFEHADAVLTSEYGGLFIHNFNQPQFDGWVQKLIKTAMDELAYTIYS